MYEKTFSNIPFFRNNKAVIIRLIDDEQIFFCFSDDRSRKGFLEIPQSLWKSQWIEKRNNENSVVVEMENKMWFTSDMRMFINESLGLSDDGKTLIQDQHLSPSGMNTLNRIRAEVEGQVAQEQPLQ